MNTREFRMQADGKTADLWIYEEIDDWWGVSAAWVRNVLEAHKSAETINVHLNSPGGMVTESAAIYNLLRNHAAHVVMHVEGVAASGASLIAMAGDDIVAYETSFFMIHEAWSVTRGFAVDHRATADLLEKMSDTMAQAYSARTRQPVEAVLEKMAAESWFTASEALEFGLADRVVTGKQKLAAKATFDLARFQFKHTPSTALAMADPKAVQQLTLPVAAPAPESTPLEEQNMKAIAKALGLSEDATEGEIVAAIHQRDKESEKARAEERDAAKAAFDKANARLAALEGVIGKEGDAALGAAKAHVEASAKLAEAEAQLAEMRGKVESDERAALLKQAKADAKITGADEKFWAEQPIETLRAYLEVATPKVPTKPAEQPASDGSTPAQGALSYQGKSYAEMSGKEREALHDADPSLWKAMREQWHAAGCPTPDSAG